MPRAGGRSARPAQSSDPRLGELFRNRTVDYFGAATTLTSSYPLALRAFFVASRSKVAAFFARNVTWRLASDGRMVSESTKGRDCNVARTRASQEMPQCIPGTERTMFSGESGNGLSVDRFSPAHPSANATVIISNGRYMSRLLGKRLAGASENRDRCREPYREC